MMVTFSNPLYAGNKTLQDIEDLKPRWDILIPKSASWNLTKQNLNTPPPIKTEASSSNYGLPQNNDHNMPLDLFGVSFLQKFTFSPTLSLTRDHNPFHGRDS